MNILPVASPGGIPFFSKPCFRCGTVLVFFLFGLLLLPFKTTAAPFTLSFTTSNYNGFQVSCQGASDGTIDMTINGGTLPFTFEWSTGATTEDISGLIAGSYIVTVVDADADTVRDTIEILEPAIIDLQFGPITNVACNGGSDGAVSIIASGGTGIFTYNWSNGSTTASVSGLLSGNYTVTVTDNNLCTVTADTLVDEPPPLLANVTHTDANAAPDGTATAAPSGGVIGYSYLWSNGATSAGITGLLPGVYTVTVTDANLCSVTDSAVVLNAAGVCAVVTDSVFNSTCFGSDNGAIYISLFASINPVTYNWSNGATTQDVTGLAPGTYTVTVTDVINCVATESFTITEPDTIIISLTPVAATCGGSNGSVSGGVTGGTGPYSYLWSNGATTLPISGLTAGIYTLTLTDGNGCIAVKQTTVANSGGPSAALDSVRNVACFGGFTGAVYISATGGTNPLTYLWSTGATTQDLTSVSANTYTVTVTDANLCTATVSGIVTQPAVLNDSVQWVNASCGLFNGSITVFPYGGTSPYTYQWNSGQTTQTVSALAPGTYTVTIRDANLCSRTRTRTITNQAGPVAVLDSVRNVACNGGSTGGVFISVSGGTSPLTYLWSNAATTQDISGVPAATYTVTVSDANLCTSTVSGTVSQPPVLNDSVRVVQATCGSSNGSITEYPYGGTSPYTYQWSSGQTTQTISGLAAGTYTVTIRDANNCSRTRTNIVSAAGSPVIAMDSLRNVRCNGQATGGVFISVSGGTIPYTYLWSNSATTQDLNNVASGTYTVTVTDLNGCTAVFDTTITQPSALAASVQVTNATCGQANGSLTVNPSGGTSPYTFLWSSGQTTQTISGLVSAVYTVTVSDANSCTLQRNGNVGNTGGPVIAIDSLRNVRCNGQANGAVYISVSAGTSPYTYVWSTGATTQDVTGLVAGSYTVTVTDFSGCIAIFDTLITQPAVLNETVSTTPALCGQPTGSATVTPSGGTSPYSYLWNTGQTTASISGMLPGTYTVTITDANSCTKLRSVTIGNTGGVVIVTDSVRNVRCFGQATGAVYISITSGTAPYVYQWTGGSVSQDLINVVAGTYTVTVTDDNSCVATQSFTITQPAAALNDTVQSVNPSCGLINGSVTVFPFGGTGPYSYQWNGGQTTQSISGLAAGTYTVTIRDANLCSRTRTRTLTAQGSPVAAFDSIRNVTCNGLQNGAIYISVSGGAAPVSYQWNSGQTTQDITGLNIGTYTVTVTDANSCSVTLDTVITQPANLSAATQVINARCSLPNGSVTVNPSGGTSPYTYLWNTGQTTQTISGIGAGTYTVTVTDANLCTRVRTINVTNTPGPTAVVDSVRNVRCNGAATGAVYITASGGTAPLTYAWSNSATTQDLLNVVAGNYTVTITDANNCTVVIDSTVIQPAAINDSLQITNANCGAPSGIATVYPYGGTSPYTYLWSGGQTTATIFGLAAGSYTVTITDAFSCTRVSVANVSNNGAPAIAIDSIRNVRCFGGSTGGIFITVNGGTSPYGYQWSNGATTQDLNNVPAAAYTVTITDANSCISIVSGTVTQPTQLLDSAVVSQPVCGAANGTATVYPYGGTGTYTYQWSGGQTTQSITLLAAGTYTVTVRDANNCSRTRTVTLTNQGGPSAVLDSVKNVKCFGNTTGAVYITVTGGALPLSFLWSNNATTEDITSLPASNYTVTVTDSNGCTAVVTAQVTQPALLNDSLQVTPEACNNTNGSVTVFAYGGVSPYSYLWNTGQTTASLTGLNSGPYTVTITDLNLCTKVQNVNVGVSGSPSIVQDSIVQVRCNGGATGGVFISATGGQSPYTYLWSNGATTQDLSSIIAGTYSVIVSDQFLCRDTAIFTVNQPPVLADSVTVVSTTCGAANGSATVFPFGGTATYTYLWSGGQTTQTITGQVSGNFSVTVTDANACTVNTPVVIPSIAPPAIQIDSVINVSCNGAFTGAIYISVLQGTPNFQYQWSNFDITQDITGLPAGSYTVTVTDANSCTAIQTINVTEPAPISDSLDVTDATCGIANGAATIYPYGGNGSPFTYLWSTGATTQSVSGLASGFYAVTVTDAGGCSFVETVSVSNLNGPQAIVDSIVSVSCNGNADGAIYLSTSNGTLPFTYLWSNSATTEDISGLQAGVYSLTVTDANNCLFVNSYTVVEPDVLSDSALVQDATCGLANGSITLYPYGGSAPFSFLWNTGATTQVITGLSQGTYTVTITDAELCTKQSIYNVVSLPGPQLTLDSVINVNCFGDSTGAIFVNITGGTAPLSYLWSNGATTEDVTVLPAGSYTITVTDINSCSATVSAPVTESPEIAAQFTVVQASCNTSNGSIAATISGGLPGYTYLWNNGETTSQISGLSAGTYTLTVTDQLGCNVQFSSNVSNISAPVITVVDSGDVTCAGLSNGFILVNVSSGTPPYNYAWSNTSQTGNFITNLAGNTLYTLTITDSIGCIALRSVFISDPPPITINASVPQLNGNYNISCFGGNDGSVAITVSGGTPGYTYLWSTLASSDSIGGLTAGTYTVTVTDLNNCTSTGVYTITEPPQLVSQAGSNNVICGVSSDTLDANTPLYGTGSWSVLSGSGTFFNPFQPNTIVTGLGQGANVFQWIVTDGVCSSISQVVITYNSQTQALAGSDREVCADSVILTATAPQFGYGYWQVYASTGTFLDSTSAVTLVTGLNPGSNIFQWNVINGTCYDSSLVNIFVNDPSDCIETIEIPTGITPNDDGRNDMFVIKGIENYPDNVLVVYNRWGNKVYEQNGYDGQWKGTNNSGDPLPDGTYFYIFKIKEIDKAYTNFIDIRR